MYRVNKKSGPRIRYNLKLTFGNSEPCPLMRCPFLTPPWQFSSPAASLTTTKMTRKRWGWCDG